MKAYNIGLFIKKKREEQHIRQEDLCRGICDKSTLSRIERGKQEPSSGILGVLLQRLGINEDQLAVLLGPKDFEISDLQKEIVALNSQKEYEKAAEKNPQARTIGRTYGQNHAAIYFALQGAGIFP